MKITKRLENIEAHFEKHTIYDPIIAAIDKHIYYDKLPKDEYKTLYCNYIGIKREIFEKASLAVLGDLHFMLDKFETPTETEIEQIITEAEQGVFNR